MRLMEYQGKELLARHGIPVPAGALWPALPEGAGGPLVAKAQVVAGGRGKRGGIQFVDRHEDVAGVVAGLLGTSLGTEKVEAVYVEERIAIEREIYLAAIVDRDRGTPAILASADGGMEIESVAAERIIYQPVDPLLGLRPFMVTSVLSRLGLGNRLGTAVGAVIERLYTALIAEDATLIEINPLAITADGQLIAADARVILDDDALYRHTDHTWGNTYQDGTQFERLARALEVIGVEFDGDIAAIMSGAGVTMATLDQIEAHGGSVRALIELHGALRNGPERIAQVIELLADLEPRVLLVNAYFQIQHTDALAEGVALGLDRLAPERKQFRTVVRLRGVGQERAHAILANHDCYLTIDLDEACQHAVRLAAKW
jgi:succinyl-CoA synthetase beta subunit